MEILLKSMGNIFISAPYYALVPTLLFAYFYLQSKQKFILTSSLLWLLYMFYEFGMKLHILCHGECIRIDLLVVYPILIVVSIIVLVKMVLWVTDRSKV